MANSSSTHSATNQSADKKHVTFQIDCVGDDSTGAVPDCDIAAYVLDDKGNPVAYQNAGYDLYEVKVIDGTPTPDAADISLTGADGVVNYTEANVIPASGSKYGSVTARHVSSALTMSVANQGTASAQFSVYITLRRP